MYMTKIGLLGCGAIGSEIAMSVCEKRVGSASLVAIFDQDAGMAAGLAESLPSKVPAFTNIGQFLSVSEVQMVVECASPGAVRAYAESIISSGKDLLMISSGALTDTPFFHRLSALAEGAGRRLIIPSGALGGIDAIRATSRHLEQVILTTTKPPKGLQGAPGFKKWEGKEITEPTVVFTGSAAEAIKLFPANVNVGATLSLAGIGPDRTMVKVVADPDSPGNVHEIYASGDFGTMRFTLQNRPHDRNPRTSYLAVLSVLETLREACTNEPRIGT